MNLLNKKQLKCSINICCNYYIKTFLTSTIYPPDEDTFLFTEILNKNKHLIGNKVLELGSGSGFTGILLSKIGFKVDFSDINEDSIDCLKLNLKENNINSKIIQSDLFSNIKEKYNTIIFNPPYLPKEELFDYNGKDVNGGKQGIEVILKTLKNANEFLENKGNLLFIISNLANIKLLEKKMKKNNYNFEIIETKNVGLYSFFNIYNIKYNI